MSTSPKRRRPTKYDRGQHQLICDALGISDDPNASGLTAYEGVCVLILRLGIAKTALISTKTDVSRAALKELRKPLSSTVVIPMFTSDTTASLFHG